MGIEPLILLDFGGIPAETFFAVRFRNPLYSKFIIEFESKTENFLKGIEQNPQGESQPVGGQVLPAEIAAFLIIPNFLGYADQGGSAGGQEPGLVAAEAESSFRGSSKAHAHQAETHQQVGQLIQGDPAVFGKGAFDPVGSILGIDDFGLTNDDCGLVLDRFEGLRDTF